MKNHPLNKPDFGDSFMQCNFDRRTIGYHNKENLEIYTAREAADAICGWHSMNTFDQADTLLNLVNTIEAYDARIREFENSDSRRRIRSREIELENSK